MKQFLKLYEPCIGACGSKKAFNIVGYLCGYYCVGASRGFAFVEFTTLQEATRWMEMKQVSEPQWKTNGQ